MCVHEKVSCAATKKSLQSSEGTRCCLLCGHVWIISKIINWYKTYNYILFSLLLQLRLLLLPLERKERETGKRWCMHARTHARTHLKVITCRANPSRVDVIKRHKKVTNCPPLHASQTHTYTNTPEPPQAASIQNLTSTLEPPDQDKVHTTQSFEGFLPPHTHTLSTLL